MLSDAKDILKFYITWLLYKTNTAMQSAVLIQDKQLPTRKQE